MWQYMTRELEHSTVWPCRAPPPLLPHRKTLHPSLDPVECPRGPTERTAACCQLSSLPLALGKTHTSQPARQSWNCWIMWQLLFISSEEECVGFFPPLSFCCFSIFPCRCVTGEYGCCCPPPTPQLFRKAFIFWSATVMFTTVACLWHWNMLFFTGEITLNVWRQRRSFKVHTWGFWFPRTRLFVCDVTRWFFFYIFWGGFASKTKCAMKEKERTAKQTLELCALGCFKSHWRKKPPFRRRHESRRKWCNFSGWRDVGQLKTERGIQMPWLTSGVMLLLTVGNNRI